MTPTDDTTSSAALMGGRPVPLVIASILRPEGTTGVHTHVRELCAYLDEKGLPYEVVTPFSWRWPLSKVIFSLRVPLQWLAPPASVAWYRYWHTAFLKAALRQRLAGLGQAVIYAQGPEAARASVQARQGPDQRIVMAVHFLRSQAGGWVSKGHITPTSYVAKAIKRSERAVVRHLDAIVYVSDAAKHEFLAAVPGAAEIPSDVVPNFVRPLRVPPDPEPIGDLVTVGGLEVEKNQEFLLRVLANAKDLGRVYTLDIFGRGPLRPRLRRLADNLDITNQVRFHGYDPAVRSRLPAYRAYVHACAVETGPLALIEALAAGLPIVAAPEGGVPELLTDGLEGRFWPLDDPVAAARILIGFLEDEHALESARLAARRHFSASFRSDHVAPRLTAFLHQTPQPLPHSDRSRALPQRRRERIMLDGMAIRPGGRGVARVLKQVLPLLAHRTDGPEYVIVTSEDGRAALPASLEIVTVPRMPMSLWEQLGLPEQARRLRARAVYCHAECGPLWGPPVVLHVPEDPYTRWAFSPADSPKEHVRRVYQRATTRASVLRSPFLITSSQAVADQLIDRFGHALPRTSVVPLGVDDRIFYPDQAPPREDVVFHLGSEARDQTLFVLRAYARALQLDASLPDLAIAGNLGHLEEPIREQARSLTVEGRVHLLGRVTDEDLRSYYANAALCVQPAIYEGFGLQPLEALACAAVLLISATPAVEEVVQDAAIIVPRRQDLERLATAMAALWSDTAYRRILREKALKRSHHYTWQNTADTLHAILQQLPTPGSRPFQVTPARDQSDHASAIGYISSRA
jgi:glycosyltransferase involved in cell wall biosynthesis